MIAETLEANGKSRVRGLYDDFRSSKRRRRNVRRQSVDFFIILNLNYKKIFSVKNIRFIVLRLFFQSELQKQLYLFYFLPHDPPPSSNIGFKPYDGVEPHHAPPLSLRLDLRRDLRLDLRRDLRLDLRRDLRLDLRRDLRRDFLQ
jgi:hypothetical protein